jgi:hypothetical protein
MSKRQARQLDTMALELARVRAASEVQRQILEAKDAASALSPSAPPSPPAPRPPTLREQRGSLKNEAERIAFTLAHEAELFGSGWDAKGGAQ